MEKEWFVYQKDHHKGPFNTEDISKMFLNGDILEADFVWKEGLSDWTLIKDIKPSVLFIPPKKTIQIKAKFDFREDEEELPPDLPDLPDEAYEESLLPPIPNECEEILVKSEAKEVLVEIREEKETPVVLELENDTSVKFETVDDKKRKPFFIYSLLGIFLIAFGISQISNNEKFYPEGISQGKKVKLEKIINFPLGSVAKFRAIPFDDAKGLWAASNYKGEMVFRVTLKSIPNKILSKKQISIYGFMNMENHWGNIKDWIFERGTKLYPGYYELNFVGTKTGRLDRFYQELKKLPIIGKFSFIKNYSGKVSFKDKILLSGKGHSEFNKKLTQYWAAINLAKNYSGEKKLESYRTFNSIIDQIFFMYKGTVKNIGLSSDMNKFEVKYAKTMGPMMRALILENYHLYEKWKFKKPKEAKEYFHLFEYGKDIGELVSNMVTQTIVVKSFGPETKIELLNKFKNDVEGLKLKGDYHLKRIQKALPENR